MNPEPTNESSTPPQPSPFSFDQEAVPPADSTDDAPKQPTPAPVSPQPVPPAKHSTFVKLERTSGVAMYMLAVLSGLLAVGSASYLIGTVLHYFIVDKSNAVMFFDLSSIDLYFIVAAVFFSLTHFVTMGLVRKGSSNVMLGFRHRHEIVSAVWQTLLALTIISSLITFVYTPLNLQLNHDSADTTSKELTVTLLSAGFVLLLSATLLWRDRMLAKGLNDSIPTIVSAVLLVGVIVAGIVMISQPEQKPKTPDYSSMMNGYRSSSSSTSDFSTNGSSFDSTSNSGTSGSSPIPQ